MTAEVSIMFSTNFANIRLMASTARVASPMDGGAVRLVKPPTVLPQPKPANEQPMNLAADIAERLEQDPDYQILRKTFALDARQARADARAAVVMRDARVQSGQGTPSAAPSVGTGLAGVAMESFELRVTQTQSMGRWEFTASGSEMNSISSFTVDRRQTLELTLGGSAPVQLGDPLVLDLGGRGIMTTGIAAGVDFDLDADGRMERMSTVTGDSWFLALDWNANGRIDDGRELFGDQNGAAHGFDELARHDSNLDGIIDEQDALFERLRLVQLKGDGSQVSQSLSEAKVVSIDLGYQQVRKALDLYDQVAQSGRFTRADGGQGEAADVLLGYRDLA
jgi:hypothetical protein